MTTETRAAFAARLGVNRSTVTRWIAAGRLVTTADGDRVDVEASLARLKETEGGRPDVAQRHADARGGALPLPTPGPDRENAPQAQEEAQEASEATTEGRARYKAVLIHAETQQLKLAMALRRGWRYPLDEAGREAHALGGILRAALERFVDQIAPRLAGATDPAARLAILQSEAAKVARQIKQEFPRAMRRLRAQSTR